MHLQSIVAFVFLSLLGVQSFSANSSNSRQQSAAEVSEQSSRRQFVKNLGFASVVAVSPLLVNPQVATASGGATAGGAYLLSAKQRYNDRVTKAVRVLIAASVALEAGDAKAAQDFFSGDEVGTWKDVSAAGYLLSNAFRRTSTTPPDSLPAVKKWKAFAAEIESFQKLLKKKGAAAASESFPKVEAALEVWLEEVSLPPPREI